MPRKLPWAQNGAPTKRTPVPQKTLDPAHANASDHDSSDRGRPKKPTIKRRQRSRSRSTSPPPQPPSVEPMREGFEEDDIWMIVEDEFEALAKTFTAHLHHAEYKKLMKRARDAPPKPLPIAASPLSKETIRRIQRDNLKHKQQEALNGIGAGGSRPAEDTVEDPWRGTSIAGLIASGSQKKRSLKGIDRLPSSTRAAQGFARPGSSDGGQQDPGYGSRRKRPREQEMPETGAHPRPTKSPIEPGPIQVRPPSPVHSSPRLNQVAPVQAAVGCPSIQHKRDTNPTTSRPPKPPLLTKRKNTKKEASRKERLSQVPMFLI